MGKTLRIKTDFCKWLFGSYDWLSSRKQTEDTFYTEKREKYLYCMKHLTS